MLPKLATHFEVKLANFREVAFNFRNKISYVMIYDTDGGIIMTSITVTEARKKR